MGFMCDLLFTGDCFVQTRDGSAPFARSMKEIMNDASNVCVNLETTVGSGGTKIPKAYNFQVPPKNLIYLKDYGVTITSVANNHSLDYGVEGFHKTIENLRNNDFNIIGSKDTNVCIIHSNDISYCISSYYGYGGAIPACNEDTILANIKQYRQTSDVIIVCVHWGEEYSAFPKPKQQRLARKLIDNGVDVIIGHHPHVPQGVEIYKEKPIFYSLGNFNFNVEHPYHNKLSTTKIGYCVQLSFSRVEGLKYDIVPICINELWQPKLMTSDAENKRFNDYLLAISKPLLNGVTNIFYYSHSSIHIFRNYYPSWRKQIKEQGFNRVVDMIKWHLHPSTFIYYAGAIMSLFVRNPKY